MAEQYATVNDYISSFPEDIQRVLQEVRRTIRDTVPESAETMSYQVPTATLHGKALVYFAGWKRHISVYPVPAGDEALERDLAPYRAGRGTLRFMLDKPIPYDLIRRSVAVLAGEQDRHTK